MTRPLVGAALPKLIIDITPLFEDHWTGIPIFTRRLIQALVQHGGVDLEFSCRLSAIPKASVMAAIRSGTGTFLRGEFERNAGKAYPLINPKLPIFYPSVKESFGISQREASTIHDVSSLVMPEYHESANVDYHMRSLARQLETDDAVFCVSEATQAALLSAFPSVSQKIRLLPQYVDWPQNFAVMERNLPPPIGGQYAAVIGTVEPRKNLTLLIKSLAEPQLRNSKMRFVVMGKQGWKVEQLMAALTPSEQQRIVFLGYVTEFMKYRLLKHASFLVYPSLYEGFGIPALEALSCGKPVLASLTSSFPDIVGDAGVFFDPLSTSEFAAAFAEINDLARLADLQSKAMAAAAKYNSQALIEPLVHWVSS